MNVTLAQSEMNLDSLQYPAKETRAITHTVMILAAFTAFQAFNYSTTVYALKCILGNTTVAGIYWAVILAFAFCVLDVAGIARLFMSPKTPARTKHDRFLFAAWLLTAGLNALLTWYGIVMAISIQQAQAVWVVNSGILIKIIPAFLTIMVWIIRILIIGAVPRSVLITPASQGNSPSAIRSNRELPVDEYARSFSSFMDSHVPANPFPSISHTTSTRREPTYRGLPIRYKTD